MNKKANEKTLSNMENKGEDNDLLILEQGDIYFFYRPKKNSYEPKGLDDIRRFFMVTAYNNKNNKDSLYRLFVIGKKSLPEIRHSEARLSERYWARVGGIYKDKDDLTKELFSDEFRKGDSARPVGFGKYIIVKHKTHSEIAYILETPEEPGEAQKELGIEKEAIYIISVINPNQPTLAGNPSSEESPKYPDNIVKELGNENYVSLTKNTELIDYLNAQIILIGAKEGKHIIKEELKIDIEDYASNKSQNIFKKLNLIKENIPIKPLMKGKFE
ncbi:MAG TPA: hypothetical protein VN704_09190 [Verrucomicrobiae bacterium]|nr:hypothetical protein [Verrucomicrobiae bacterium]